MLTCGCAGSRTRRDIRGRPRLFAPHAADDPTPASLMPVNRRHGIDEVLAARRAYPLSKRQVIFIEYLDHRGANHWQGRRAKTRPEA